MELLRQATIILAVSFAGEGLRALIPLPIPASIYGIVLMLLLLCTGIVKVGQVEKVGRWLIQIMPVLFIPPTAKLIGIWDQIAASALPCACIALVSTLVVMGCAGWGTQLVLRHSRKKGGDRT